MTYTSDLIKVNGDFSSTEKAKTYAINPVWQNYVTLGGMLAMWGAWFLATRTLQDSSNLERSVFLFAISIILFETLETCLIQGTAATALLGTISVTIYTALFSKRPISKDRRRKPSAFIAGEGVRFRPLRSGRYRSIMRSRLNPRWTTNYRREIRFRSLFMAVRGAGGFSGLERMGNGLAWRSGLRMEAACPFTKASIAWAPMTS